MIHEFDLYIYPRKLWVTYDATPEELNKEFPEGDTSERIFKEVPQFSLAVTDTSRSKDKKGGVLIRFADKESIDDELNILHESIHAANFVFDYIGATHDVNNDEPYAYLVTYIAKCCATARDNGVKEKQKE